MKFMNTIAINATLCLLKMKDQSKLHGDPFCESLHIVLGGAFLNFNNVIVKKDFHNFFEYYDNPIHREVTC
jgi:hypothetical protein